MNLYIYNNKNYSYNILHIIYTRGGKRVLILNNKLSPYKIINVNTYTQ